tara:strand:- start:92 stop:610 length:519 start_codon:yes stop_codon:yes gene_type:complete
MSDNVFNTKSRWICLGFDNSADAQTLTFNDPGTIVEPTYSNYAVLQNKYLIDFQNTGSTSVDGKPFPTIQGIYYLNLSFTTSEGGNINATIVVDFFYRDKDDASDTTTFISSSEYTAKGNNKWAINVNTIVDLRGIYDSNKYIGYQFREDTGELGEFELLLERAVLTIVKIF